MFGIVPNDINKQDNHHGPDAVAIHSKPSQQQPVCRIPCRFQRIGNTVCQDDRQHQRIDHQHDPLRGFFDVWINPDRKSKPDQRQDRQHQGVGLLLELDRNIPHSISSPDAFGGCLIIPAGLKSRLGSMSWPSSFCQDLAAGKTFPHSLRRSGIRAI